MKVKLTDKDRVELLKMWKSGYLETDLISGLKDIIDKNDKPLTSDELKALQYKLWREDCGFSDEMIEEEKRRAVEEGEEPFYLMKYIEARRERKGDSFTLDKELRERIKEAEIELVELGKELNDYKF